MTNDMKDLEEEAAWYHKSVGLLQKAKIPFLIGGAYALWKYTGVRRPTKDLDLFLRAQDMAPALKVMREGGFRTEITASHWIGKAFHKDFLMDFIVALANGVGQVDDTWFKKPVHAELCGKTLSLVRPEDMVWSKAFVMERDRYDGADIVHLLWAEGRHMDWKALLRRFVGHEAVLLSHLILFGYIYPDMQKIIPAWVIRHLGVHVKKTKGPKLPLKVS